MPGEGQNQNHDPQKPGAAPGQAGRFMREMALVMELPFVIVGAVVAGGLLGYFLDRWLHTAPVFLIVLGCVGTFAGIREVMRRLGFSTRSGKSSNGK